VKSWSDEGSRNENGKLIRSAMKGVLFAKAAVEMLAGLAFALFPSSLFFILLGVPLDASGANAFRMFGGAIFAIGLACWLARNDGASTAARALVTAAAFYDIAFVAILLAARFIGGLSGIALWPTVALHLGLAVFSVFCLRQDSVVPAG
jgi:hypothetical protein